MEKIDIDAYAIVIDLPSIAHLNVCRMLSLQCYLA